MKVILPVEFDHIPDKGELILSDDHYDVVGFIDIRIGDQSAVIHVTDLMPAVVAFDAKYSRSREVA